MTGIIVSRYNEVSYKTAIHDRFTLHQDVTNYPTKLQYITYISTPPPPPPPSTPKSSSRGKVLQFLRQTFGGKIIFKGGGGNKFLRKCTPLN